MILSEKKVRDVALLARLGLSDDEVSKLEKDLSTVLDFFKELEEYSPQGLSEDSAISSIKKGRSDIAEVRTEENCETLRKNFPDSKDAYLKVRSVFSE